VVMDGNIVRNKMIQVEAPLDNETLLKLNMLLNTNLNGLTVTEINLGLISKLRERAGIHEDIIAQVLNTVAETIDPDDDLEVYTSGATNVFKYPELATTDSARELISAFEEKEVLADFLSDVQEEEEEKGTGIQVYIGGESKLATMKDCSVVTATYELGDGVKGTIGIIGPKRMDYKKVVENLKNLKSELGKVIDQSEDTNT